MEPPGVWSTLAAIRALGGVFGGRGKHVSRRIGHMTVCAFGAILQPTADKLWAQPHRIPERQLGELLLPSLNGR